MERIVQNSMETNGNVWNMLEATVSYRVRARLTPTLTHVVTYELVTSGAEDDAMSSAQFQLAVEQARHSAGFFTGGPPAVCTG